MKKLFVLPLLAALFVLPQQEQVAAFEGWNGKSETVSFYRSTRGFVSPLLELDNDTTTGFSFVKQPRTSYTMDYFLTKSIDMTVIKIDSPNLDKIRVNFMYNDMIKFQAQPLDLVEGGGLFELPSGTAINRVYIQFLGAEGTEITVNEIEFQGEMSPLDRTFTTGSQYEFITPEIIYDLQNPESGGGEGNIGEMVPVNPETPTEDSTNEGAATEGTSTETEVPEDTDPTNNGTPSGGEYILPTEDESVGGDGSGAYLPDTLPEGHLPTIKIVGL